MLLHTMRANIVQSIRAHRPEDLMSAAQAAGHHFLYASLLEAQTKQDILDAIAEGFEFPSHVTKSLDSLKEGLTNAVAKAGAQTGFVLVLEQLPQNPRFDREAREQLLDVFREISEFWDERRVPFRCFYSFSVAPFQEAGAWDRAAEAAPAEKPTKVSKAAPNANFGMNMPMMSSAFDTAMWLNAA